jgi:hypothetical protein
MRRRGRATVAEAQPDPVIDLDAAQTIQLDYPVDPRPRYGWDTAPHRRQVEILERGTESYAATLRSFLPYLDALMRIPTHPTGAPEEPAWANPFFPALDSLALYGLLATTNPATYLEIGSGNSTKFARRAVRDHGLRTKIISIDPHPRAECDVLCDEIIREPFEDADLSVFDRITGGDIVFLDGSHRVFTNSDTTVFFLEVMPELPDATQIHIHDIFIPDDYPPQWSDRYYSEQYLLSMLLLADGDEYEVLLPNYYIACKPELHSILDPYWQHPELDGVEKHGGSFWLRKT